MKSITSHLTFDATNFGSKLRNNLSLSDFSFMMKAVRDFKRQIKPDRGHKIKLRRSHDRKRMGHPFFQIGTS